MRPSARLKYGVLTVIVVLLVVEALYVLNTNRTTTSSVHLPLNEHTAVTASQLGTSEYGHLRSRSTSEFTNPQNSTLTTASTTGERGTFVITEDPLKWQCNRTYNFTIEGAPDTKHYKMVVGIVSAKRNPPTVVRMAEELVRRVMGDSYKFLLWMSLSGSCEVELLEKLESLGFTNYVNRNQYRELAPDKLRITFDDPLQRVLWRTSHVLDYANLLERTLRYHAEYVLILEDDLKPAKHALDKAYQFVSQQFDRRDWGYISFYGNRYRKSSITKVTRDGSSGACAFIIRKSLIPDIVKFLRSDPYAAPVDLMLYRFVESQRKNIYERTPNLFQHISPHSSYMGEDQVKRQTEKSRSFTFVYDEDNKDALNAIPSMQGGHIGCFVDKAEDRDLSGRYSDAASDRSRSLYSFCASFCKLYAYFGIQSGRACHCGNEFGQHGWAPESECQLCDNEPSKWCGGVLRNSVYRR